MVQAARRIEESESEAKRARDHDMIRSWVETAVVTQPSSKAPASCIDFNEPGGNDDVRLRRVPWDEFVRILDTRGLEFLYQERTRDGKTSGFNKFVKRGAELTGRQWRSSGSS